MRVDDLFRRKVMNEEQQNDYGAEQILGRISRPKRPAMYTVTASGRTTFAKWWTTD
jgi:hypothetical protein